MPGFWFGVDSKDVYEVIKYLGHRYTVARISLSHAIPQQVWRLRVSVTNF